MLHKGYTKFIMPAGIMSSASINIIRSNPIISADLSGLSVIRSFIIRMNPVYDKTDGGLNGFHRSTSLSSAIKRVIEGRIAHLGHQLGTSCLNLAIKWEYKRQDCASGSPTRHFACASPAIKRCNQEG